MLKKIFDNAPSQFTVCSHCGHQKKKKNQLSMDLCERFTNSLLDVRHAIPIIVIISLC
jgi:hypothetical protein